MSYRHYFLTNEKIFIRLDGLLVSKLVSSSNLVKNIGNNFNAILMEIDNENKLSDKHVHLNPQTLTH